MNGKNVLSRNLICLAGMMAFILGLAIYCDALAAFSQNSGFVFSEISSFYIWQTLESGQLKGRISPQIYAGYRFSPQKDGYVNELCGYFSGIKPVNLYDSSFMLLESLAVASEEAWVCAPIPPVSLRKGENYYVAAEIDGGTMYYRYLNGRDLLPAIVHDIEIKNGVYQTLWAPFGDGLISDQRAVYGLVDIGFETGNSQNFGKNVLLSAPDSGESAIKNCAGGICVYCSRNGCFTESSYKDGGLKTYLQVCAYGECLSCKNSECGFVKTKNWADGGVFFVKNCIDGQCVNCINGECFVSGASIAKNQSLGCGGRFCEADKAPAGERLFNNVFGGCANGNCGRGGIFFESGVRAGSDEKPVSDAIFTDSGKKIANPKISGVYSVDCNEGVCDLCAAGLCAKVGIGLKEENKGQVVAIDNDIVEEAKEKKTLAVKIGLKSFDTEPPAIFNLKPIGEIAGLPTTLSCDTDEDSFCKLCSIDQPFSKMCETFDETGGKHHLLSEGSLSSGDHKYYVKCRDRFGNENQISSQISFRVIGETIFDSEIDLEPPAVDALSAGVGPDGILTIEAAVFDNTGIRQVKARIRNSRGVIFAVVYLGDAGLNGDQKASDGVYGANWPIGREDLAKAVIEVVATDNFGNFSLEEMGAGSIKPWAGSEKITLNSEDFTKAFVLDFSFQAKAIFLNAISTGSGVFAKTGYPDSSSYVARFIGFDGKDLGSYGFNLPWQEGLEGLEVAGSGIDDQKQPLESWRVKIPYRAEARMVDIYDPDGKIAFGVPVFDLMGFCGNSVCEKGENGGNCVNDCALSVKDGYCGGLLDGLCDPDCSAESDADCRRGPAAILVILTVGAVIPILFIGILAQKRFNKGSLWP